MNLVKWNEIYENNKRLDKIFIEKYKNDNKLFEKNCIELLVEIGELINETKVFKYWSIKKPNKDKMLEEYADVITMILTFYGLKNIELKELSIVEDNIDILSTIHELYSNAIKIRDSFNENTLEKIFSLVINLGKKLEFNEEEIFKSIDNKQKIIELRLNSNY